MKCLKSILLKYKELVNSDVALKAQKRGDPKNEGMSGWLYENKGQKINPSVSLEMLLKTSKLS